MMDCDGCQLLGHRTDDCNRLSALPSMLVYTEERLAKIHLAAPLLPG